LSNSRTKLSLVTEFSSDPNEGVSKIGVDAPVANLVCIGQVVAGNRRANAHVVELVLLGTKAGFDISQAFAIGQLSEGHAKILVETEELLDFEVALVTVDALVESVERKMLHDLRENKFSGVHSSALLALSRRAERFPEKSSSR
jgi:hypothetical protein